MFMWMWRPLALTIPDVTVPVMPRGAPIARTRSPISIASLSPSFRNGRDSFASIHRMARSVRGSRLILRPTNLRPSWSSTSTSSAPRTTWSLVTISPAESMINPDPNACPGCAWGGGCFWKRSSSFRRSSGKPKLPKGVEWPGGRLACAARAFGLTSMLTTAGRTCLMTPR